MLMIKILPIFLLATLLGCACNKTDDSGISINDIILLNESQISNFIKVLPEIMDFSQKYQKTLSRKEKESPDANKKFFETIRKSEKMKKIAKENGFSNVEELLAVYKNVVLAYISIKIEVSDFEKDMNLIYNAIVSNENNLKENYKKGKISESEFQEKQKMINIDKIRYQNILLIKKYEAELDKINNP